MTSPTAPETSLLRSRPQNTKLYLSIFQPLEIYSGYITGSVAKGDRDFQLTNTSGTAVAFDPNVTMLVGSSVGLSDKGKVRVRTLNKTTGAVSVAENSHINWANGDYVKIIRFFEVWPVYPRIIQDPGDPTKTLWYKDYDIQYSSQNSDLGYFICMGPHHAGFLENGQHQIYFTAEGTEHVKPTETGTSYYWTFGGATPSSSTSKTPGWVSYNGAGFYTARLVVSGTSSCDFSDRHIALYEPIGAGTQHPISQWELLDLSGSRGQGGYVASIRIFEDVSNLYIQDGSLVTIFAEDWYAGTKQSIGGNATNRSNIVFNGYILDGTIRYNYRESYVDFDIGSPSEFMKAAEGFSVSVQDSDDPAGDAASNPDIPSGWVALLDMDIKRAIYHYLRWHSTVLNLCDFQYIGTNQKIQYFDADRTSIFDAINTLMSSAVVGQLCCDRQGKLYAETDICVTTGTYNTGLSLTNRDWMGDPSIEERRINEVSYLEMGGIAYNGTTFEALMACAPGATPAYRGKVQRAQGLALTDQAQLNNLVGNLYAQMNARYPDVSLNLAGNYRNFDIAPQEVVPLTVSQNDTIYGITFSEKSFFIKNVNWSYDAKEETFLPSIGLEELTSGFPADTMEIPDMPPFEGDAGGFTIPPIIIPPIELPPWPTFPAAMVNFVPAISGFSPGLTAADFQIVGQIQPNYVIYFYAGSAGVAYGHTKAPSGLLGGAASIYTVLEGFAAGTVSVEVQIFNVTQNTSVTSGLQAVVLIDGINFILPLSISYAPNDIILFVINYNAGSVVDAGIVGWSLS